MDEHVERLKTTIGIDTVQLGSIGVYHYRLSDSTTGLSTCSIIANSGPRVTTSQCSCVFRITFSKVLEIA